jgi:hypothetical protein
MPYIHTDYSRNHISEDELKALVALLLRVSGETFGYTEEQAKDLVSIFTSASEPTAHSVAAAEIEVRAKITEFDHPTKTREQVRDEFMQSYKVALTDFIARNRLKAGIVFTITFEDWSVAFIQP